MTRTGKIGPVERERIESRLDETLPPCWIRREGAPLPAIFEPAEKLTPQVLAEVVGDGEFVCVALSSRSSALGRQLLAGCLERARRTYLHAPSFGASDEEKKQLRSKHLLVRTGGGLDCDLVVGERGKHALLVLHAPGSLDVGWMRLSGEASAAAFQLFLQAFWSAPNEALGGTSFKPSLDAPCEVPAAPEEHLVQGKQPSWANRATLAVAYGADDLEALGVTKTDCLLTPAMPSFAFVRTVEARAEKVRADDGLRLPPLVHGEEGLRLLVGRGEQGLPLVLELPSVTAGLDHALQELPGAARIRYEKAVKVGEADGDVLLENSSFRSPSDEVVVDAGAVRVGSFEEIETAGPVHLPAADPLSRQVRWHWRVLPPAPPANATEAKLVGAWRAFDAWVEARGRQIERDLTEFESDRGILEKSFDGFRSFFLGANRTATALRQSLADALREKPSAKGGAGAHQLREELDRIARETQRLGEEKARTRREEQERLQHETHEKRVGEARAAIEPELRCKAALEGEITALREQMAESEKAKDDSPDAKVAAKKLRSDLHQLEQKLSAVQRRIDDLERQASAEFVFEEEPRATLPKKKSGPAFVPTPAASAPPVPDEDLPSVGSLIEVGSERMLAIATWEEVANGQREAKRLTARLVGPVEEK